MAISILVGDCREKLKEIPDGSIHCCVSSPPYFGLRDYGVDGQIGLENSPDAFVAELVSVFREVRRVLGNDGVCWLNLGDSYSSQPSWGRGGGSTLDGRKQGLEGGASADRSNLGLGPKQLLGMPWRVALALQADGWILRQDIIWSKPNPMPESVQDRCTKSHEYVFLLSKSARYHYDAAAIAEPVTASTVARLAQDVEAQEGSHRVPGKTNGTMKAVASQRLAERAQERCSTISGGTANSTLGQAAESTRNARSVWNIATQPFSEAHFATFPPELAERCIRAGCPAGGTVLDPFGGAGTTGLVADRLQRNAILIELNPEYAAMAKRRISADAGLFGEVA